MNEKQLRRALRKATEALVFYASARTYTDFDEAKHPAYAMWAFGPPRLIEDDNGARAREALAALMALGGWEEP